MKTMDMARGATHSRARRGFTLVELLMVIGIISLLVSLVLPAMSQVRAQTKNVVCGSNLRQLALAATMYANESNESMPPCYRLEGRVYWWGRVLPDRVDHTASPLYKYIRSGPSEDSVFECPEQPWGSYTPQPKRHASPQPTTTYGYNGYYLTPPASGYVGIGSRPWQRLHSIPTPHLVFMFADAIMIDPDTYPPKASDLPLNTGLLDPPCLYKKPLKPELPGLWTANRSPTTAFRHRGQTSVLCCDGHLASYSAAEGTITWTSQMIGFVGTNNDPHYIPDWQEW